MNDSIHNPRNHIFVARYPMDGGPAECRWCDYSRLEHTTFRYTREEKRIARMFLIIGVVLGNLMGLAEVFAVQHLKQS